MPGSIAAVFGNFLLGAPSQYASLPLPTEMAGLSLRFGTTKALLFYASSGQVNLQVPWELAAEDTSTLSAVLNGQVGGGQNVELALFAPGIFTVNAQGAGQGAIVDSVSNRVVDEFNPAVPGTTTVEILCTGLGAVTNQPASGSPPSVSSPSATATTPAVTIAGLPADVLSSGLAQGYVGVYDVSVQIPVAVPGGTAIPVVISIGGATSNTATIAVQGLSPSSATAGSGPVTVNIFGIGFTEASTVTFNGTQQAAIFVSGSQLTIALSAAELATPGTYAVLVTNPGGNTVSMRFPVNSPVFSLGGHSISINAIVKIGNQILPAVIGALLTFGNNYSVETDDQSALPAYPQFQAGFSAEPVSTDSTFTFSSDSLDGGLTSSSYQPGAATPASTMSSAAVTIEFDTLTPGAAASGDFTFGTAQGTIQGNFTGIIQQSGLNE